MLIDWFTVIAQAINFLILVWLLKRFLYQPILNAIDAREERIAKELKAADAKKAEAQKERDLLAQKNEEFNQQRATLLKKAMDEADTERSRFLNDARKEAEDLRAQWKEALRSEQFKLSQEITSRIQQEVFSTTRKLLTDLANAKLEEQIVDVFLTQLREQHQEIKKMMSSGSESSPNAIQVRSGIALSSTVRAAIEKRIHELIGTDVVIEFETEANLISGIECIMNGRKIAWCITDYLDALENEVEAFWQTQMQSGFNPTS
jgi:F-type H+-transporting ATPase subunit b